MKRISCLRIFTFVLVAVSACAKKDDPSSSTASAVSAAAKTYACKQFELAGKCGEYSLKDDTEVAAEKTSCEEAQGKWSAGSCPAEKQFATCALADETLFFYAGVQSADAPFVADEDFAKLDCEASNGKLTIIAKAAPAPSGKKATLPAPRAARKK